MNEFVDSFPGYVKKTKLAIVLSALLDEPFTSLYILLPFILNKSLGATTFQIVILMMLKPAVSVFSFYWSLWILKRKDKLRLNLISAEIFSRLPFFFFLFFNNIWYVIFAAAFHMFFSRAAIPAWMEIIKLNISNKKRDRLFSFGMALGYAEGIVIAIFLGAFLDKYQDVWKLLFFISASLGMFSVLLKALVPIKGETKEIVSIYNLSFLQKIKKPWINLFKLMKTRPDFARFQWGYMISGFGLMIFLPILPEFFNNVLFLSYKELSIVRLIFQGIGFVITANLWAKLIGKIAVNYFTSLVFLSFGAFPFCLLFGIYSFYWVALAYFIYGVSQAGSRLVWHMSGPIFSKDKDSTQYSGINIVMVGIRGIIALPLGCILNSLAGPYVVLVIGILCSLIGSYLLLVNVPKRLLLPLVR